MSDHRSLLHFFSPPDGYRGLFGWLCGYGATASFLDRAAENFLERNADRRRANGSIALAALLDPGVPQIAVVEAPGVAHLPVRGRKPFRLLHAKAALLSFRQIADSRHWCVRLVVSTGNWTEDTLDTSLDLVWWIDFKSASPPPEVYLARADIAAAWEMFEEIKKAFDCRLIEKATAGSELAINSKAFESILTEIKGAPKAAVPRFFDNRSKSLLEQLPGRIRTLAGKKRRNYLCMGSGFYEARSDKKKPEVLTKIIANLRDKALATASSLTVDIFVNPRNCQSIATSLPAIEREGWKVRLAHAPGAIFKSGKRDLHAKFILGANLHSSNNCASPWLYLGSGNLTGPGFTQEMSSSGNLECGVIIKPEPLTREELCIRLPVSFAKESEVDGSKNRLSAGREMPENAPQFFAAPVQFLLWRTGDQGNFLEEVDPSPPYSLLDGNGRRIKRNGNHYIWLEERPLHVTVQWQEHGQLRQATVPVVDELGRVAAAALPARDVDEVWWDLDCFPQAPESDDDDGADGGGVPKDGRDPLTGLDPRPEDTKRYPIRDLMQLVERIAAKQESVSSLDGPLWCTRLKQSLLQMSASPSLTAFKAIGVNPLSPLWHSTFRPEFAKSGRARGLYENTLREIEERWGVNELARIDTQ